LTNLSGHAQHQRVKADEPTVLSLRQLGAPKEWRVQLSAGSMRFNAPDGPSEVLTGDDLRRGLNLSHSIGAKPLLAVKLARGKLVLVMAEGDVRALVTHVGRDIVTHAAVASHAIFNILIGVLIIMSSLGPDDPLEPGAGSLKLLWMGVGGLAVAIGIAAKLRPHRVLLALDAVWMAALVANVIHGVIFGSYGIFWALFVLVLAPAAYGRLRVFSLLK
jgi:hypothetical protein